MSSRASEVDDDDLSALCCPTSKRDQEGTSGLIYKINILRLKNIVLSYFGFFLISTKIKT